MSQSTSAVAFSDVARTFQSLAEQWDAETAYLSSVHEIVLNPAYQRIIGLGPQVLPLLLHDLMLTGRFWFWALTSITGENPVPDDERGNVPQMTQRWLHWGRERGILGSCIQALTNRSVHVCSRDA